MNTSTNTSTPTVTPTNPQFTKRGLHNWKNLFRKPNSYEWTILIMLILGGMLAYSYKTETQVCRDTLNNLQVTACQICGIQGQIDAKNQQIAEDREKNMSFNGSLFSTYFTNQSG